MDLSINEKHFFHQEKKLPLLTEIQIKFPDKCDIYPFKFCLDVQSFFGQPKTFFLRHLDAPQMFCTPTKILDVQKMLWIL